MAEESWPQHLIDIKPTAEMSDEDIKKSLLKYFKGTKGEGRIADLIMQCAENELPDFLLGLFAEVINSCSSSIEMEQRQHADDEMVENKNV